MSHALINSFDLKAKQLVITVGESILSKPLLDDVDLISPCTHEEVDTRTLLHTHHAGLHGYDKVLVRTVDTDVVVLAVSVVQYLGTLASIWNWQSISAT